MDFTRRQYVGGVEHKELYNYHEVFASALANAFTLGANANTVGGNIDKQRYRDLVKNVIIAAIAMKRNHSENKADFEKLKNGKYFEDMEDMDKWFLTMILKMDIANLMPNYEFDHTPFAEWAAIEREVKEGV
ncbi:Uncharacterised protein [Candidatus Anstonella stagnisolia]|nr:Uncharacterised protein [Candidatus Anstonella stagnisolia]